VDKIIHLDNLSYHKGGNTEAKAAIVFIHGVAAGAWCFENMAGYFNALDYATYRIDLPGHGTRKKRKEKLSLERYRLAARRLVKIAKTNHEKVFVVGHSMGGLIAQTLDGGLFIEGLALLSPAPTGEISHRGFDFGTAFDAAKGAIDRIMHGERNVTRASLAQFFNDPSDPVIDRWAKERVFEPITVLAEIRFNAPKLDLPSAKKIFVGIPTRDIVISDTTQGKTVDLIRKNAEGARVTSHAFPLSHMFIAEYGWQLVADSMRDWMKEL
jgi:pimeloyl-ACP methyl ester carboxylesterase